MSDAGYHELFPLGADEAPYRKLTGDYVLTGMFEGSRVVKIAGEALTLLAAQAFLDSAHLLRPGHLAQLRAILDDPEASANDKFVASDLLKNANIAAGRVLPMCQDTGTAIVMGKKGQQIWTDGDDAAALSAGIRRSYREPICATASWRRCRCTRRSTPATTCRRRSISSPSPETPTNFSSSPRAAARLTGFLISRARRW
jgi:hypothetical protein